MSLRRIVPPEVLDAWRRDVYEDIWIMNQSSSPIPQSCDVYIQRERDVISEALRTAFDLVRHEIGFSPMPGWWRERIPLPYEPVNGMQIQLGHGRLYALGVYTPSVIQAAAAIAYSDEHGVGVDDTATISLTGVSAPAEEIAVFFTSTDSGSEAGDPHYRIGPLKVVKNGTNATITGHRALFVKPDVWHTPYESEGIKNEADHTQATDFVTTVDVYHLQPDATNAVLISGCGVDDDPLTAKVVDGHNGVIELTSDGNCTEYGQTLDVYYQAGQPLEQGELHETVGRMVSFLGSTLIPESTRTICNPARTAYEQLRQPATVSDLSTRFGSLSGQVQAYQLVEMWRSDCHDLERARRVVRQEGTV